MRKNTLLIATAVTALTLGSGMAFAQAPEKQPAAPAPKASPAAKTAPAEKMAPPAGAAMEQKGAQRTEPKANEPKAGQGAQRNEEKTPANRMGQSNQGTKSKSETTGQAPSQPNQPAQRAAPKDDKLNSDTKSSTQPNRATGQSETQSRSGASGSTSASVNLTAEQRTKIHSVIIAERSAPRVASVNFQLNVGVAVPRSVRLAPVPTTIVEIQPTWRGFEYFLVGDEIVIVDPASLQIVAIIPA
jgi:uncharacterized protein DUF1236